MKKKMNRVMFDLWRVTEKGIHSGGAHLSSSQGRNSECTNCSQWAGKRGNQKTLVKNCYQCSFVKIYFPSSLSAFKYTYKSPHTSEHLQLISAFYFVTLANFKSSFFVWCELCSHTYTHPWFLEFESSLIEMCKILFTYFLFFFNF